MIHTTISTAIAGALLTAVLTVSPAALAKSQPEDTGRDRAANVASSSATTTGSERGQEKKAAATSTEQGKGEDRRSEVATGVQALLAIADRDGGIGEEVRAIAREHASSTERANNAKEKAENRPSWMTVLIGADYGSLGALRSELVTTENQIKRLTDARDRASDPVIKAALDVQIEALQETASSTEAFIKDKEDSFSLFGWLFRLF